MRRGASGCCSVEFIGVIRPLKFTGNTDSNFSRCTLFLCLYCVLSRFFFAELSTCFSDRDICCICRPTLIFTWHPFRWGFGVPRRPYFHCCLSFVLFSSRFAWCVFFTLFYMFGARDSSFFPNRAPSISGSSVLFDYWLICSYAVWNPSWSIGAQLFGVFLTSLFFINCLIIFFFLLLLPCAPNRSGTWIYL